MEMVLNQVVKKILPDTLTTLDILKTLAVLIMICDHTGKYFFPDDLWWRAVGRIGFPVWFFLVGYAKGRDISKPLLIGTGLLIIGDLAAGMTLFPLNALATIICLRLTIDRVMKTVGKNVEALVLVSALSCALIFYSNVLLEYGTLALLFCMFGYFVRHREDVGYSEKLIALFAVYCFSCFVYTTTLFFDMSVAQLALVVLGSGWMCWFLYRLKIETYPVLSDRLPWFVSSPIQFMGRKTLEIYVAHLLLFKGLVLLTDPEHYVFFHWKLTPLSM